MAAQQCSRTTLGTSRYCSTWPTTSPGRRWNEAPFLLVSAGAGLAGEAAAEALRRRLRSRPISKAETDADLSLGGTNENANLAGAGRIARRPEMRSASRRWCLPGDRGSRGRSGAPLSRAGAGAPMRW